VRRLGPALRHDPALASFLVFALSITAFDVFSFTIAAFDMVTPRHLQELIVPYTGWVPSMCYAFSLYFAFSALLTGNTRARSAVLIFPVMQVAFGIVSWIGQGGPRASDNPYLRISEWRPLWTIALPLVWLALLATVKPKSSEAATLSTTHTSG
jgi:hypothetical protein